MLQTLRDLFTPEQRRVIGNEARQLLENKHFREAWDALDEYLTAQEHACDPDNAEKARRIVISRQLLVGLKREFERKVQDGEFAQIELNEIERKTKPLRFIR